MYKLPNKFYSAKTDSGSSSTTPTSNKKYEITITQPPEHDPRPDFIRGIPYSAKDNVMFCKFRKMTLDDMKEMNPSATEVSANSYILQDINDKDIIITSDQIEDMLSMRIILVNNLVNNTEYSIPTKIFGLSKTNDGDSITLALYACVCNSMNIFAKISDVDYWFNAD